MLPTPPQSPRLKGVVSSDNLIGHVLPNTTIELQGILGVGAYGTVYIARDLTTNINYAVKSLNKVGLTERQRNFLEREITLHSLASSHPNVVSLIDVVETPETTFVVLEYCPEGDLFANITEHSHYAGNDYLVKSIFCQLLDAVEFIHSIGVYHRDIKPENILITDGGLTAKLADFGLACTESCSSDFGCGSTFYMSPECLQSSPKAFGCYSSAANDVWSLGVVLINLTCGRNPWKKASVADSTFAAYLRDSEFLKSILPLSDQLDCVLRCIFECDPSRRITIPQLRQMILQCTSFTTTGCTKPLVVPQPVVAPPAYYDSPVQYAITAPYDGQQLLAQSLSQLTNSSTSSGSDGDWLYSTSNSPASVSPSVTNNFYYPTTTTSQPQQQQQQQQDSHYIFSSPSTWYSALMPAFDLAHKHLSFHPTFPVTGMRMF